LKFYNQLEQETAAARDFFLSAPIIGEVFEGKFNLDTYIAFLNQAYHHVKHTVPLLMLAGGRLQERQLWLQGPIGEYIREESGHEAWILDDIEVCGYSRQTFADGEAPFDSDVLVSFLYDTVQRRNPVGIFGMVLVLEGTSASLAPEVARIVQKQLSLPDSAMTYLTSHGVLDQDHIQHFENIMNRLVDANDQAEVIRVANSVYRLYGNVYRAIAAEAESIRARSAA